MGWAKTDEDIRDTIDSRMRDRCNSYHGNTYINYCPNCLSKKTVNFSKAPQDYQRKIQTAKTMRYN